MNMNMSSSLNMNIGIGSWNLDNSVGPSDVGYFLVACDWPSNFGGHSFWNDMA